MDVDPRIVKRLLVGAVWVGVALVMVPLARRKGVPAARWYFLGLAAFYAPFLAIVYGPMFVAAALDKNDRALPNVRWVLDRVPIFASAGVASGLFLLRLARRRLGRLPDRAPLP
jgi:cell division protein FtsW (lipid II flippase)